MSLVTREEYERFGGEDVSESDFDRFETIAEDIVFNVCVIKPTEEQQVTVEYKKALCYQIEMLQNQGGIGAIVGMSEADTTSEKLGDYSVTRRSDSSAGGKSAGYSLNGIPVSSFTVEFLRRIGLMKRWAFAEAKRG